MKFLKVLSVIAVIVHVIAVIVLLSAVTVFLCAALITIRSSDTNSYLKTDGLKSPLILFPNDLDSVSGKVDEYHYVDYRLRGGSEIFLKITYSDISAFRAESDRLSNLSYDIKVPTGKDKFVRLDNRLFANPAVVSIYNNDGKYEYALFDETALSVIYVFIQYFSSNRTEIPAEFLPFVLLDDSEKDGSVEFSYNIYSECKDENWYD